MNWTSQTKMKKLIFLMIPPIIWTLILEIIFWTADVFSEQGTVLLTFFMIFLFLPFLFVMFYMVLSIQNDDLTKKLDFYDVIITQYIILAIYQLGYVFVLLPKYQIEEWLVNLNIIILLIIFLYLLKYRFQKKKAFITEGLIGYDNLINEFSGQVVDKEKQLQIIPWQWTSDEKRAKKNIYLLKKFIKYFIIIIAIGIIILETILGIFVNQIDIFQYFIIISLTIIFTIIVRFIIILYFKRIEKAQTFKEELIFYENGLTIPPILQSFSKFYNINKYAERKNIPIPYSKIETIMFEKNYGLKIIKYDKNRFHIYSPIKNYGLLFGIPPEEKKKLAKILEILKGRIELKTTDQLKLTRSEIV